ncbi:unnamed protein product [Clonostachys rhizophaga]|uniref:F-box domain-containing protein n=1 Tax=Clonostachys rhizophaga TaxID=160324 RepID=A0A9N9VL33_9HYPO|nr:unnamed protein product [Clonostachys rhizophaga]
MDEENTESVDLPPEIWTQIFTHFLPSEPEGIFQQHLPQQEDCKDSLRDLRTFCLVSRRWRLTAQPILYKNVIIDNPSRHGLDMKLLRTLALTPELASKVRTCKLLDVGRQGQGVEKLLAAIIRSIQVPHRYRNLLRAHLLDKYRPPSEGLAGITLALATKARRIEVSPGPQPYGLIWMLSGSLDVQEGDPESFYRFPKPTEWSNVTTIQGEVAKGINSLPSYLPRARDPSEADIRIYDARAFANYGLPHLTDLHLNFENEDNRLVDLAAIRLLFHHPSLEILRLSNINWLIDSEEDMEYQSMETDYHPIENKIHTIDLRNSAVNAFSIRHILTNFSSLRYFSVELHDFNLWRPREDEDIHDKMWNFESAEFGTALRRHGRSLVELRLETWQYYYDDWERGMSRAFGSLARIPLRRLEIELHELVPGYNNLANDEIEVLMSVLPLELEELTILGPNRNILTGIGSFLRNCFSRPLRMVNLEMIDSSPLDESETKEIDGWIMEQDCRYTRTAAGRDLIRFVSFVKVRVPRPTHSGTKPALAVG